MAEPVHDPGSTHEPGPAFAPGPAFEPGQQVSHPGQPGWGTGQVQSVAGPRVTVNFENAGKVLINTQVVSLIVLHAPAAPA